MKNQSKLKIRLITYILSVTLVIYILSIAIIISRTREASYNDAKELASSSDELNAQADQLKNTIKFFKV